MRRFGVVITALVAVTVGAVGGYKVGQESARLRTPSYSFYDEQQFIIATGTWRGEDLSGISAVDLSCDLQARSCQLMQADTSLGALSLYEADFGITHLDESAVTASNIPALACIRQTILIDRLAKTVTFSRSKISDERPCDIIQDEPLTMRLGD